MNKTKKSLRFFYTVFASAALLVSSCSLQLPENIYAATTPEQPGSVSNPALNPTPLPTRTKFKPGEMVDYTAINYSISPRLLLALLEYQGGALSDPEMPTGGNLLGLSRKFWETPYLQ